MTPAERMARHRAEMELALREGLSLDAARLRLSEARLRRIARCGRHIAPATADDPAPAARPRSWMDRYENY